MVSCVVSAKPGTKTVPAFSETPKSKFPSRTGDTHRQAREYTHPALPACSSAPGPPQKAAHQTRTSPTPSRSRLLQHTPAAPASPAAHPTRRQAGPAWRPARRTTQTASRTRPPPTRAPSRHPPTRDPHIQNTARPPLRRARTGVYTPWQTTRPPAPPPPPPPPAPLRPATAHRTASSSAATNHHHHPSLCTVLPTRASHVAPLRCERQHQHQHQQAATGSPRCRAAPPAGGAARLWAQRRTRCRVGSRGLCCCSCRCSVDSCGWDVIGSARPWTAGGVG